MYIMFNLLSLKFFPTDDDIVLKDNQELCQYSVLYEAAGNTLLHINLRACLSQRIEFFLIQKSECLFK